MRAVRRTLVASFSCAINIDGYWVTHICTLPQPVVLVYSASEPIDHSSTTSRTCPVYEAFASQLVGSGPRLGMSRQQ